MQRGKVVPTKSFIVEDKAALGKNCTDGRCKVAEGQSGTRSEIEKELPKIEESLRAHFEGMRRAASGFLEMFGSDVYKQRLARALRHPDNERALDDFLVLDNAFQGVFYANLLPVSLAGLLLDARRKALEDVWSGVKGKLKGDARERARKNYHYLETNLPERSAQDVLRMRETW